MNRLAITLIALAAVASCLAQTGAKPAGTATVQTVSVKSKGDDVRSVLTDLFGQTKKSFVLEPNIRFVLYLSLSDMEFEEALDLICKTAGLKYEVQNGIYFVSRKGSAATSPEPEKLNHATGKLSVTVLRKHVTTNFQKVDFRELCKELTSQSGVMLEVNQKVPNYKLDVVLKNTTLKYALETVCHAAGLTYRFTDSFSIEIYPADDQNRVTIHSEAAVKG